MTEKQIRNLSFKLGKAVGLLDRFIQCYGEETDAPFLKQIQEVLIDCEDLLCDEIP